MTIKTKSKDDLIKEGWAKDSSGSLSKSGYALKFFGVWNQLLDTEFDALKVTDVPNDTRYAVEWLNTRLLLPEYLVKEVQL